MLNAEWIYDPKGRPVMNLRPKKFEVLLLELIARKVHVEVDSGE